MLNDEERQHFPVVQPRKRSAQPYIELFWDLSSVWCTRTDMGSPHVRPLSQHTRCLIALPGLPSSGAVAKFLYMFVLTRHLLSSEKDVCRKDMKWNTIFLLQMQHFIEYPTLIFFHEYFSVAYEQLYGFVFLTNSLQCLAYLKCTTNAVSQKQKQRRGTSRSPSAWSWTTNHRSPNAYQKSQ